MIKKLLNRITVQDWTIVASLIFVIIAVICFNYNLYPINKMAFMWLAAIIMFTGMLYKNVIIGVIQKNPNRERYFMIVFKGTISTILKDKKENPILDPETKKPRKTYNPFEGTVYMTGKGHISKGQLLKHLQDEMKDKNNIIEDVLPKYLYEFACKEDMHSWTGFEVSK